MTTRKHAIINRILKYWNKETFSNFEHAIIMIKSRVVIKRKIPKRFSINFPYPFKGGKK